MKTIFLCTIIFILLISVINAKLSPCSSGNLTTAYNKQFQMSYSNENFLQVQNIDLLKDVNQLKDLTCLQYMDATDRTIKGDITYLKHLKNLEVFSLYSNPEVYGDICSVSGATNLRSLKFAFDPKITGDISCLKNLTKLETFAMTHTQISGDLSVFADMPNLKAIYISGTNLRGDICMLSNLTNLEELGIADEYPGNPDIIGDLSCLKNLKKLTRVALYNTKATNCEQFTKDHSNIEQGGCSKDSLKTLVDYAQKYENKIGKETQTEVKGQPNYQQNTDVKNKLVNKPNQQNTNFKNSPVDNEAKIQYKESNHKNFLTEFMDWIKNFLGQTLSKDNEVANQSKKANQIRPQVGPGSCRSQAECDTFCEKPENQETCSKFDLRDEKPQLSEQQIKPSSAASSKPICRISILPSSHGTAPYEARVCVDNPNERLQQDYQDYVDFTSDGSWDYQGSEHGCHSYTFQKPGTFSVTAKIVDTKGIESDICQTTVIIN